MKKFFFARRKNRQNDGNTEFRHQQHQLSILSREEGHRISPMLFGASFEDINHSADGGLNSQLIKNPCFNFPSETAGWTLNRGKSRAEVRPLTGREEGSEVRHLVELKIEELENPVRFENGGYQGIPLKAGTPCDLELRLCSPGLSVSRLKVFIENSAEKVIFQKSFRLTGKMQAFSAEINADEDVPDGKIVLELEEEGLVLIGKVSLFSRETFRGRPGGLRKDLAECIESLSPSFMRFPGGSIVEGASIGNAYNWKDTIGPVEQRKTKENLWGYTQSYGLGFFEFFQFCEDIGAEPVPVIFPGMSNQYLKGDIVPIHQLSPYIQDALDLIEYANGPPESEWGSKRTAAGHREPFNLKYISIGNIQPGKNFFLRFRKFFDAIHSTYPEINIIMGGSPGKLTKSSEIGEILHIADRNSLLLIDEHFYMAPQWLLNHTDMYSFRDRRDPGVIIGEYCCLNYERSNNLMVALAEAAFMLGLEKDSDHVMMAAYAPLLAREGATQWEPDLIFFNHFSCIRTPSYHVQQLFSHYKGDYTVPVELSDPEIWNKDIPLEGKIGFSSWDTDVEYRNLEVTDHDGNSLMAGFGPLSRWEQNGTWEWDRETESIRGNTGAARVLLLGESDWSNYTLKVQAKKNSGDEGFLVLFGARSLQDYYWVNLGGWGNTDSAIEKARGGLRESVDEHMPITVENNRWYDISIELRGSRVWVYLDGTLIKELKDYQNFKPLHGAATGTERGDLYIKLVNVSEETRDIRINLPLSQERYKDQARLIQISGDPRDRNSFESPEKISPRESTYRGVTQEFFLPVPPWSLNILCLEKETV